MSGDLLRPHMQSEGYARIASWALFGITALAIIASIFLSPLKVMAVFVGVFTIYVAFWRPQWLLGFLLCYLPFESFLLKWISDDIYVFARYYSEIIIYLLCGVIVWRLITHQITWRFTYADLPFTLFVVVILASSLLNLTDPFVAALGIRQIIRFILLYFVAVQLRLSDRWMKIVAVSLAAILFVQVLLGAGQFALGERLDVFLLPAERKTVGEIELTAGTDYFWDPGQRVFGTLGRYDRLGVFMAFLMLLCTAVLYERKTRDMVWQAAGALLVVSLPILALTYSRSAWFGFLLGFIFIGLIVHRDKRIAWALGAAGAFTLVYLIYSGLAVNDLIDLPGQSLAERFFEAFSMERWRGEYYGLGRLYWMVQTVIAVVPAAFIFGHGPASYGGGAVAALNNTQVYDQLGLPFGVYGTQGMIDNNWFSIWGETGTLGLFAFLWLYIGLFFLMLRIYRRSKRGDLRVLALGLMGCLIAVALNAFLATFFEIRTLGPYVWTFLGFAVAKAAEEKIDVTL